MFLLNLKLIKSVIHYIFPVLLTVFVSCKEDKELFVVSEDPLIYYSISGKNIDIFFENLSDDGEMGDLNDKAISLKEWSISKSPVSIVKGARTRFTRSCYSQ